MDSKTKNDVDIYLHQQGKSGQRSASNLLQMYSGQLASNGNDKFWATGTMAVCTAAKARTKFWYGGFSISWLTGVKFPAYNTVPRLDVVGELGVSPIPMATLTCLKPVNPSYKEGQLIRLIMFRPPTLLTNFAFIYLS